MIHQCFQLWAWETLACIWEHKEHKITKYYRPKKKKKKKEKLQLQPKCALIVKLCIYLFLLEKNVDY